MAVQQHHHNIVWQIASDYSTALLLMRLPGHTPMPAFRDVIDVPLVCRRARRSSIHSTFVLHLFNIHSIFTQHSEERERDP
jgi:hypothetical protein